jgi:hypothetical protein
MMEPHGVFKYSDSRSNATVLRSQTRPLWKSGIPMESYSASNTSTD